MYSEYDLARVLRGVATEALAKGLRGQQGEISGNTGSPVLEQYPTCQLKAELRRRRKEGGWFRYILWRMRL